MKPLVKTLWFISVFLLANGLDAQDDFISAIRLDHWAPGSLVKKNGQVISGEINYDYTTNFVQVKQGSSVSLYSAPSLTSIHFDWFDTPQTAVFRNLRITGPERMYRVLFENQNLAFLSYYDVISDTHGQAISLERPTGSFTRRAQHKPKEENRKTIHIKTWKERFLIVTAKGEVNEIGAYFILPSAKTGELKTGSLITEKGLIKKLRNFDASVADFLENNHLDLSKRDHIMRVFASVTAASKD